MTRIELPSFDLWLKESKFPTHIERCLRKHYEKGLLAANNFVEDIQLGKITLAELIMVFEYWYNYTDIVSCLGRVEEILKYREYLNLPVQQRYNYFKCPF